MSAIWSSFPHLFLRRRYHTDIDWKTTPSHFWSFIPCFYLRYTCGSQAQCHLGFGRWLCLTSRWETAALQTCNHCGVYFTGEEIRHISHALLSTGKPQMVLVLSVQQLAKDPLQRRFVVVEETRGRWVMHCWQMMSCHPRGFWCPSFPPWGHQRRLAWRRALLSAWLGCSWYSCFSF